MALREASETIGALEEIDRRLDRGRFNARERNALIRAKQALDILATLEEELHLNEPVTIEGRWADWRATRNHRTHLGDDVVDALGQLTMTLSHERAEPEENTTA